MLAQSCFWVPVQCKSTISCIARRCLVLRGRLQNAKLKLADSYYSAALSTKVWQHWHGYMYSENSSANRQAIINQGPSNVRQLILQFSSGQEGLAALSRAHSHAKPRHSPLRALQQLTGHSADSNHQAVSADALAEVPALLHSAAPDPQASQRGVPLHHSLLHT